MKPWMVVVLVVLGWIWQPVPADAEPVTLSWSYNRTPPPGSPRLYRGFQVSRCSVVPPAATCSTFVDLPLGIVDPVALTWTDSAVVVGGQYCYAVQAVPVVGTVRSPIVAGSWTCGVVSPAGLASPTGVKIVPQAVRAMTPSAKRKVIP